MFLSNREKNEIKYFFDVFISSCCEIKEDALEELQEQIKNENIKHCGFTKFNKVVKNNKEFYVCDLICDSSGKSLLFEKNDNYLVWQRQNGEDSFYGYLAYKLKNGEYWVVEYDDY